jgi:hypothetical protein
MRMLIAAVAVAGAAALGGQAVAADLPFYPPVIEIPDVDYGVEGSFYLRGSAAGNLLWSHEAYAYECVPCGAVEVTSFPFTNLGYGYSIGAGFGYETGTGLRFDATVDYLNNDGITVTKGAEYAPRDGDYSLNLRSTIALANAYYDFSFGGEHGYGAAGGAFGYVGAGAGVAFNHANISSPSTSPDPAMSGHNASFAAAAMVGAGYDFGAVVADIGYRGLYINQISNGQPAPDTLWSNHNLVHEVRGSVRYRFN